MVKWDELSVFIILGALVTVIGFLASRWRRADLNHLDEWGLGGRRFGTVVTWFLLGGDLYTAYTFIAVPALVFGSGATGLFAVPYTIIVYPLVFLIMPKLWQVARNRGYVTASDYVKDRFDSRFLALLVAITGIVATMPYIALQIFGIRVVIASMGVNEELALIIAFVVLAAFTYASGLRAPALIALVKDTLIWITVLVAVIYIPIKLGGYGAIFSHVPAAKQNLAPAGYNPYATLALGSALALFLYPHAITGVFSSSSQNVVKRNAALLPAYSFLLGLIALLGYMAIAAGIKPSKGFGNNDAIPSLFQQQFSGPFVGFAFAAIAIGALVPASVMSIAAANLFSRNIWREFVQRRMSFAQEATLSKIASLVVKGGALLFILAIQSSDIINLQLAGGVWILQTLPAVVVALYVRRIHSWAAIAGWFAGEALGTYALVKEKFQVSTHDFGFAGKVYIGFAALFLNLLVVAVGSLIAALAGRREEGSIRDADYDPHSAADTGLTDSVGGPDRRTIPATGS